MILFLGVFMSQPQTQALIILDHIDSDSDSSIDDIALPSTYGNYIPVPFSNQEFSEMKQTLGLSADAHGINELSKNVSKLTIQGRTLSFITTASQYRFGYAFGHGFSPAEKFIQLKGRDLNGHAWKTTEQDNKARYNITTNHLNNGQIEYKIVLDESITKARLDIDGGCYIIDTALFPKN